MLKKMAFQKPDLWFLQAGYTAKLRGHGESTHQEIAYKRKEYWKLEPALQPLLTIIIRSANPVLLDCPGCLVHLISFELWQGPSEPQDYWLFAEAASKCHWEQRLALAFCLVGEVEALT